MKLITGICLTIFSITLVQAQVRKVDFGLYNAITKESISDVHVFVGNATFGAVSNAQGIVEFMIPQDVTEELVISHISYDLQLLKYSQYNTLKKADSIFLQPNGFKLEQVLLSKKRPRKWRKNFKKFKEAFLGKGKTAKLCEIKNPEVLRFSNDDGEFKATAIDLLQIKNDYLGYEVSFLLDELKIDKDGSKIYSGYPRFKDVSHSENIEQIRKNRKESYVQSLRHFLLHLINRNLNGDFYKMREMAYQGSQFEEIYIPKPSEIVLLDSLSGLHHLRFKEFLEVTHLKERGIIETQFSVGSGSRESRRFNNVAGGDNAKIGYQRSFLYKTSPSLIINKYGNILNHKHVKEYGFWAEQRVATMLPFDYGFEMIVPKKMSEEKPKEIGEEEKKEPSTLSLIKGILFGDTPTRTTIFKYINENWERKFVPPLLDLLRISENENVSAEITALLLEKENISNYYRGLQWMWEGDPIYDSNYDEVKAEIFGQIDTKFVKYFKNRVDSSDISIDEIVWGGVGQDGIPPLRFPKLMKGPEADYLGEEDIVFGIVVDGEATAYPKRILAWHEFVVDSIGGIDISGVYCTLCGTMIAYNSTFKGIRYELGTSGFLYRSNKLMYDKKSQSLWSTIEGKPVMGTLINQGIQLNPIPVVTTSWKAWLEQHPNTKVLSLETGHKRNYNEGEAYKNYFASDELMFPVPLENKQLRNKQEVFIVRPYRYESDPLAIATTFLRKKKVYQNTIADKNFVILADKSGQLRAYFSKKTSFRSYKKGVLKDEDGYIWEVSDDEIRLEEGLSYKRIPSHNIFWFAWYNMYPKTRLIK